MGEISAKKRHVRIVQKRKRYQKIKRLKSRFAAARTKDEKERIAAKIHKIAPFYPV